MHCAAEEVFSLCTLRLRPAACSSFRVWLPCWERWEAVLPGCCGAFAVVGMAATFTAIVFLFELTLDYQVILPLMLESLMTEKLARRGLRVQTEYEVDVLHTTLVRDVMTRDVQTLPATARS